MRHGEQQKVDFSVLLSLTTRILPTQLYIQEIADNQKQQHYESSYA